MKEGKWPSEILTVKLHDIVSGLHWLEKILSINVSLFLLSFCMYYNKGE